MKIIRILLILLPVYLLISCDGDVKNTINPEDIPVDSLNIQYITEQINKEPKNAGLLSLRAEIFFEDNQTEDAIKDAIKAQYLDSLNFKYYLQLSNYYVAAGQSEKAKNTLLRLTQNLPDYAPGYVALAKMYLYAQDYNTTEKYLREAESRDRNIGQIYFVRGLIYRENKNINKAIDQFLLSIEKDPELYDSYVLLGLLHAEKKDTLAAQYYQAASRIKPENVEPLYNEAMFWQENEKYDRAIKIYQRIIAEKDSNNPYAYYNQGYILLNFLNKSAEAIPLFTKALEKLPDYTDAQYNIGLCYEDLSQFAEARKYYQKTLEMEENYPLAIDALNRLDKHNK